LTNDDIVQEITVTSTTPPTTSISQISAVKIPNSLILSATYDIVYSYHQAFIDADNNPATGYFVKSIGADFLVENSRYYDHKGNIGSDWLWQQINGTVTSSINNHQYVWQLPLASLKLSITSSSKIVFAGSKDDKESYSAVISVIINNS
ncbi:unnamed protein product, partial [Rotaria sp. Silwood2]